ncbi:MAG: inositol monophosphatase family protein [Sphingomonadaceae bacterium]
MKPLDGEMRDLLQFAAQRAILPRYRNLADTDIEEKSQGDPVTIADRETEQFLREALHTLAPDIAFVGEEAAHADPSILDNLSGPCWIVDPVDGTHNFAQGRPPFGIIVALADAGEVIAGWIFDPLQDRLCHARRGEGAFINGERIHAKTTDVSPPVVAVSTLFTTPLQQESLKTHIFPHYTIVDIPRCAAEQYPRLALGENDVSLFERTLPWDHGAGVLWLNEAGGKAARPDGSPYKVSEVNRTGLIGASSPQLWEDMANRIVKMR